MDIRRTATVRRRQTVRRAAGQTARDAEMRRRAAQDRRPARLTPAQFEALFESRRGVAGLGSYDTMAGMVDACETGGVCDGMNGATGPPRVRELLKYYAAAAPDTRVHPRYDCRWGDWRHAPGCQKLLGTMGLDTRTLRRREDAAYAQRLASRQPARRSRQPVRLARRPVKRRSVWNWFGF